MALYGRVTEQKLSLLLNKPWFLPVVICIGFNLFGILLSTLLNESFTSSDFIITESRQESILSIVASSLMTLIGVTFSISMLILSSVSSQFGPRLMPNFIHSKISQVTLGLYLGTFIFCIFCIYYPASSVVRGIQTIYIMGLTLSCLFILVVFLNRVVNSIQIDGILSLVVKNTQRAIDRNYSENGVEKTKVSIDKIKKDYNHHVACDGHGYIEGIDYIHIKEYAKENRCIIHINVKPGDFVYPGYHIMSIEPEKGAELSEQYEKELNKKVYVVSLRTLNQDIEYGFDQISEIAVRALSPGINDPYTARECVYLLGELFLCLDNHEDLELNAMIEDDDNILLIFKPFTYDGIINAGLSRIRQAVGQDITIIHAFYDMILKVTPILTKRRIKRELLAHSHELSQKLDQMNLGEQEQRIVDAHTHQIKILEEKVLLRERSY